MTTNIQGSNGNPLTLISPEIGGTLQANTNQTGYITVIGGTISSLYSQALGWKVFSTAITNLTISYSGSSNPKEFEAFGCTIGALTSNSSDSSATFNDCVILL